MIISRTPFRVSFAGGGTDLREFYSVNGHGTVVSAAIQKYMYIVIHPYFQDKIRIKYSQTEDVSEIDEIKHPIVRECLRKVNIERGLEIASFADVPAGTGLGSSSAFTVGLLNALYAYQGRMAPKKDLARQACEIEIDILGEPIGKQDQFATAFGGLNRIRLDKDESVTVTPLILSDAFRAELTKRLRLYYIGGKRYSRDILTEQKANTLSEGKFRSLRAMSGLAEELWSDFKEGRVEALGAALHRGWMEKRRLATGITNDRIDALYERFRDLGAAGGKLLGAGRAGFLLIYASEHGRLSRETGLRHLTFEVDDGGTKIIHHQND